MSENQLKAILIFDFDGVIRDVGNSLIKKAIALNLHPRNSIARLKSLVLLRSDVKRSGANPLGQFSA